MEEKIELIKQIVQHHPSYGTDKGWSEYTGGMKDSGHWYWEKLIEVRDNELRVFLNYLIKEQYEIDKANEERRIEYKRVEAMPKEERDACRLNKYNEEKQKRKEISNKIEYQLMFGK